MPPELILVVVLRTLVEVTGWFLIGQGLLYLLSGANRERNPIYRLFQLLTSPVVRLTRAITPKVIIDRHIPFIAFVLLFWSWVVLALIKRHVCAVHQLACV